MSDDPRLTALPDHALWRALVHMRDIPLSQLIAVARARREVGPGELIDAIIHTLEAREHRLRGEHEACVRLLDAALPQLVRHGALEFAITSCLERSHAEIDWGDYSAALASLEQAEQWVEDGVDRSLALRVKASLGRIYSRIGNHQTAIRILTPARDEAKTLGLTELAATWSINIAVAAMRAWEAAQLAGDADVHMLDEARRWLDEAAQLLDRRAEPLLATLIEHNRACIHTFEGRPELAIPIHEACDRFHCEHQVDALISSNRIDWAKALIATGRLAEARQITDLVIERAQRGGQLFAQTEAMRLLADLNEAEGDTKAALAALRRHHSLSAKVAALEALQRADALQVRLETQRVKAEREAAEARNVQLLALNERLAEQEARMRDLSERDHLTGVANRRHFETALDAMLNADSAVRHRVALALVDVDHFKPINDQHGHAAGDAMLRAVASAMMSHLRLHDVVARIGGDEFAFAIAGADASAAIERAQRIASTLRGARIEGFPGISPASLSIGIALSHENDSRESLFARADAALYAVKREGRDGVRMVED